MPTSLAAASWYGVVILCALTMWSVAPLNRASSIA